MSDDETWRDMRRLEGNIDTLKEEIACLTERYESLVQRIAALELVCWQQLADYRIAEKAKA